MQNESNIERHARIGQTSRQLADRNSVWRLIFCGILGAIAAGLTSLLLAPAVLKLASIVGLLCGIALAVAIESKMKSDDIARKSKQRSEMAAEKERETLARIATATANGDFDRWKKDE